MGYNNAFSASLVKASLLAVHSVAVLRLCASSHVAGFLAHNLAGHFDACAIDGPWSGRSSCLREQDTLSPPRSRWQWERHGPGPGAHYYLIQEVCGGEWKERLMSNWTGRFNVHSTLKLLLIFPWIPVLCHLCSCCSQDNAVFYAWVMLQVWEFSSISTRASRSISYPPEVQLIPCLFMARLHNSNAFSSSKLLCSPLFVFLGNHTSFGLEHSSLS